jgi:Mrp family chromosome partitioning ATPase
MDRIQRALEISRLQRGSLAEVRHAGTVHNERATRPEPVDADEPETAAVPKLVVDRARLREQRIVLGEESSTAAHAYRMLRAQILQRARASRMRVFGIVSAATGEGKTLTAINLAISLATEPNQSVTLVDLDLRRPSVTRTLGLAPEWGIDTWLGSGLPPARVICELEGFPRLRLVPTLAPLPGSSDAIAGARTRELFEAIGSIDPVGITIVDLPPALLSDHVLTVAPLIDGFVFVINEGRTLRDDVERVLELLGRNRIVGTVLNGSSASEQRAY